MTILTATGSAGMGSMLVTLVLMLAVFYFMLIRPENKRKKEAEQMRSAVKTGDKITTIWMAASYSGDDDFEMYTAEELTVTDSTSFGEAELPDGSYAMVFEMWDAMGNDAYSDAVTFDCENGEIWTTVYE